MQCRNGTVDFFLPMKFSETRTFAWFDFVLACCIHPNRCLFVEHTAFTQSGIGLRWAYLYLDSIWILISAEMHTWWVWKLRKSSTCAGIRHCGNAVLGVTAPSLIWWHTVEITKHAMLMTITYSLWLFMWGTWKAPERSQTSKNAYRLQKIPVDFPCEWDGADRRICTVNRHLRHSERHSAYLFSSLRAHGNTYLNLKLS